mgnify:CR=1 FL=1|jgi:hypothetical protein
MKIFSEFKPDLQEFLSLSLGSTQRMLHPGYPALAGGAELTREFLEANRGRKIFVEYPLSVYGLEFEEPQKTVFERTVIASEELGTPGTILVQHGCWFRRVKNTVKPLMVSAKVAGYRHAVYGIPVADKIGNDRFIHPQPLWLNQQSAELGKYEFGVNSISALFRFNLTEARYAGLVVEKIYTLHRDNPILDVKTNVLPHGGYRPFTYRTNIVLSIGMDQSPQPYAANIGYLVPRQGTLLDFSGPLPPSVRQRSFVKAETSPHSAKGTAEHFEGEYWIARNTVTGESIVVWIGARPVELFAWLRNSTATMEWIYPPAYPDNDPHKVAAWNASYTLEYKDK